MKKTAFTEEISKRRKKLRMTTDMVAAEAGLGVDVGGTIRNGGAWLRGIEAGKPARIDRDTCNRIADSLGIRRDALWLLLLLDERKLDPEIRAYYEEAIATAGPKKLSEDEGWLISEVRRWPSSVLSGLWMLLMGIRTRSKDQEQAKNMFVFLLGQLNNMPPGAATRALAGYSLLLKSLEKK